MTKAEFCGLPLVDIDIKNRQIRIDQAVLCRCGGKLSLATADGAMQKTFRFHALGIVLK